MTHIENAQAIAKALTRSANAFEQQGESGFFLSVLRGAAKIISSGNVERGLQLLRLWTPIAEIDIDCRPNGQVDIDFVTLPSEDRSN